MSLHFKINSTREITTLRSELFN
jgi:hypothetical protein